MDHFDPESFQKSHYSEKPTISIHLNSSKPVLNDNEWGRGLADPSFELTGKVPWAEDAYYLSGRPSFTMDPLFHAGAYYVQEASGMFVSFALNRIADLSKKLKVLDLCAAPGGKSTLLQSIISPESILLSNEVIKTRVPVLTQNITKWGGSNGVVSSNDPHHFKKIPGFFDILIVDAPCSGSGLFRKDPVSASSWSEELVTLCSHRQERILADVWDSLKDDGFLIYCTCSYSKEENEDILDHLFDHFACISVGLKPDPSWNIVETQSDRSTAFGYRFYPDRVSGEGFFLAVVQKKSATNIVNMDHPDHFSSARKPRGNRTGKLFAQTSKNIEQQIQKWVISDSLKFLSVEDSFHALSPELSEDFEFLKSKLYLKKAGVRLGKAGDNEWIPDHELALANILRDDAPALSVSKSEAIEYLRGNPFQTGLQPKGWHTVCFQGQHLGWAKLLDKRMNNYYPKSWRIRQ